MCTNGSLKLQDNFFLSHETNNWLSLCHDLHFTFHYCLFSSSLRGCPLGRFSRSSRARNPLPLSNACAAAMPATTVLYP